MADAKKLRSDIQKLKKALQAKGVSKTVKDKLQGQLDKAESELAASKKPAKSAKPKKSTPLNRLQSLVKKKKYSAYSKAGVDLKKDAGQPALPTGKRTSKSGKTYYEYRANRIDVKQPPKRYPKLEDGGETSDGKIRFDMYGYIHANDRKQDGDEIIRVSSYKEAEEKAEKFLNENKYELVELYRKDDFVGSIRTKKNFAYSSRYKKEDFADGGGIPEGYHKMPDGTIMADSAHMAKGGETKHYKDNVKEQLENLNEEISSIDKYLKKLENENSEDAYKASNNLRQYKSSLEAKKLHLEDVLKEKGGYMAKGGLTKEKLMDIEEEFDENEDDNYHSENVVLLARYFGTKEDLKEARSILKKHKEEGYLSGDNSKKRYELSMKLFDKWDEAKKEAGIMAKGGEVKVGDVITAKTGVKVKVVEYDPKFGGRVKVMRMDEYGTGEPSQFMRLSKFKYGMGGYMAEGGVMSTTHRLSK